MPLARAVAVLVACALTVLALPSTAPAVEAAAPPAVADIASSRFPSIQEVARVLPVYRGGARQLTRSRQMSIADSTDCIGYDAARIQPRAGKFASYTARGGQSPYFSGGTSVSVGVYDFGRPKRAQAALEEQRDTIRWCVGERHEEEGYQNPYAVTYRRQGMPNLGDDRFAFRRIAHDPNTGSDWFVEVYVRQGRFLVNTFLQRDRGAPPAVPAFRVARLALRAGS